MAHELDFERVAVVYGRALTRLAAAYEPDAHEREDLVQDILFALWRALPSFRGECSERTFVYRVAHNRALTHRRRGRQRGEVLQAIQFGAGMLIAQLVAVAAWRVWGPRHAPFAQTEVLAALPVIVVVVFAAWLVSSRRRAVQELAGLDRLQAQLSDGST